VILEFTRRLVHETLSRDALQLAVYAARDRTNATNEEINALIDAVMSERETFSRWPKDFA